MDEEAMRDLIRLMIRFYVALSLYVFTEYCKKQAGLDPKETKNQHLALHCASHFNKITNLLFEYAFIRLFVDLLVNRIRIVLRGSLDIIVAGSISLLISLSLFAYYRCFVVGG